MEKYRATRADYARRRGVNRSTVTRWIEQGRVVLDGDRIDVAASDARLGETGGARPDVAARHAATRSAPSPAASGSPQPPAADSTARIGNTYQAARAVREKYAALSAQADYEKMIGNLLARDDVELAMKSIGAAVRAALEVLPDQTAPLVAPVSDLHEVHALIADACRNVLHNLGAAVEREREKLIADGRGAKS